MLFKTDNDTVYTDRLFTEFCSENNVKPVTTSPYIHEENAHAEIIWRELAGVARAMLRTADMDYSLWPLAFRHANWLRNRKPVHDNFNLIPYIAAFSKTFSLSHFLNAWW